jgi:cytoskeleton protein RodZ
MSRLFLQEEGVSTPKSTVQAVAPTGSGATEKKLLPETNRAQTGKKILEIEALDSTWIRIEPDTGPAEELMMARGDRQVFSARRSFYLQTGNAGGIRLRFDGKDYPPLGRANQTLSLTLP